MSKHRNCFEKHKNSEAPTFYSDFIKRLDVLLWTIIIPNDFIIDLQLDAWSHVVILLSIFDAANLSRAKRRWDQWNTAIFHIICQYI